MNFRDILSPAENEMYDQYQQEKREHMKRGTNLLGRVGWAKEHLDPVDPKWCALWEDPYSEKEGLHITYPSKHAISALMRGYIINPLDSHWSTMHLLVDTHGNKAVVPNIDYEKTKYTMSKLVMDMVIDYRRSHNEVAEPMTFEEAHEYCFKRSIPNYCWSTRRNRPTFAVITPDKLPPTRTFRNSWRLADYTRLKDIVE